MTAHDWPADAVSRVPTASLVPYARNARTHSEAQVAQIAASMREFGWTVPLLIDEAGTLIAGHGRLLAAQALGIETVPVMVARGWSEAKRRAYVIADNKLALNAGWDEELLALELSALRLDDFDLELTGFDPGEIDQLLDGFDPEGQATEGDTEPQIDRAEELRVQWGVETGQLWQLGEHRLLCGDSTKAEDVARVMGGEKAALLHADPPYGMGKEAEGVQNDNLCGNKLDAFQMAWWLTFRQHLLDNASAYIWGNPADLWRLWYVGGLADSERLTMRTEVVWKKGSAGKMQTQDGVRCYPPETERCLFFMLGEQCFNNNADNYWDGWEPIRAYLDGERVKSGLTTDQCNKICGKQNMTQSAFTRGGFRLILEEDYNKLKQASKGNAFKREYDELKREYDELKREYDELKREWYATRAYFDNTHDNMTDVWEFGRVTGSDRHGHATPKPVAMIERAIKSSTPEGAVVAEPFSGSGTTLIACENLNRRCRAIEISPGYVAVALQRWADHTGKTPVLLP
jgi:DNA modification methylase